MSFHILLNLLLNKLRKKDQMRGLPSILSLFHYELNKSNNRGALMLDSIYHMTQKVLMCKAQDFAIYMPHYHDHYYITLLNK